MHAFKNMFIIPEAINETEDGTTDKLTNFEQWFNFQWTHTNEQSLRSSRRFICFNFAMRIFHFESADFSGRWKDGGNYKRQNTYTMKTEIIIIFWKWNRWLSLSKTEIVMSTNLFVIIFHLNWVWKLHEKYLNAISVIRRVDTFDPPEVQTLKRSSRWKFTDSDIRCALLSLSSWHPADVSYPNRCLYSYFQMPCSGRVKYIFNGRNGM